MQPFKINLVKKKNLGEKTILAVIGLVTFAILVFSMVNIYDYYANTKVIETYENRIEVLNRRTADRRVSDQRLEAVKAAEEKLDSDLNYIGTLMRKSMFPLTQVLSEIERIKPDRVEIDELTFSENLSNITIIGGSHHVGSVSKFILALDRSDRFEIQLSKEEIDETHRILFVLTAKWMEKKNDPAI